MKIKTTAESVFLYVRFSFYLSLLFSFFYFFNGDFYGWSQLIPESAWAPSGISGILLPMLALLKGEYGIVVSYFLTTVFVFSTIASALGYRWRTFSFLSFVLSVILFGLKNSFGHVFKADSILIVAQIIFVLQAFCYFDKSSALRSLQLLWVCIFFLSALHKLKNSGLDWVLDNYVYDYLRANQIVRSTKTAHSLLSEQINFLCSHPLVGFVYGIFVLSFELLYPLIWLKNFRWAVLILTIIFQTMTYAFLGIHFSFYFSLIPIWLYYSEEKAAAI